jgi:cAMP-dependent protein kinase regulator
LGAESDQSTAVAEAICNNMNQEETNPAAGQPAAAAARLAQVASALLSDPALAGRLVGDAGRQIFEPGAVIFRQGARPKAFYLLLSGEVCVSRHDDGQSTNLNVLGPGSFFGEMGMLEDRPRSATVQVMDDGPAEVLVLDRAAFGLLMDLAEPGTARVTAVSTDRFEQDSVKVALPLLGPAGLAALLQEAQRQSCAQGETIMSQGDAAESFYILVRGRVEVLYTTPEGRTFLINFHEPGEYFGEIGVLTGAPRAATVRAAEDCDLLVVPREVLEALLADNAPLRADVLEKLRERRERLVGGEE